MINGRHGNRAKIAIALLIGTTLMGAITHRKIRPIPITKHQAEFLTSEAWLTALVAGRGAGKTRIGAHRVCKDARNGDPWMAVSPDSGVITETTLPTFLEVAEQLGCLIDHKLTPYPKVRFRTQDGGIANIVFRSGEKPKKLHGSNKAGLWIDEASLQSKNVFLDAIPTLRWRGKMGPCLITMTPKGKTNWTFETLFSTVDEKLIGTDGCSADGLVWIGGRPYRPKPNTKLIHATSRDNPFLPDEFYDTLRGNMSSQLADQELGGNFLDIAGLMFKREWFKFVDEAPRDALRVRYWDKAATDGSGSFTAGVLMALTLDGRVYIEDVVRGQWSYHARDIIIEQTAELDHRRYGGEVVIIAEQEGGSGGKEVMHQMITKLGRFPVQRDIVGGKQTRMDGDVVLPGQAKVTRALPFSGQAEAGNVHLVRGDWNRDYLDEVIAFPESSQADQVDATSGAFNRLKGKIFAARPTPQKESGAEVNPERFGALAALEKARTRRLFGMGERNR
ncbi:MAG: phage terminase large subunit [Planctomycetaceae bacterium]